MSFLNELRSLNPLNAKDYDEIVQRIEVVAKRDPAYYRKQLLILACLGYVYIACIFLLINAAIWLAWRLYSAFPSLADRSSDFIAIALLVAVYFFSKFLVSYQKPEGITLTRKDVPELFEMLDRVARSLKAPTPHRVILQDWLNAAVFQQPLFGFIGWHTNHLLIGLPLMQALSPEQFEAVIAHEFAHLRGGDSKFGAWVYRIRSFWSNVSDQINRKGKRNFLFGRFFNWYGPFFKAFSFVHARAQEYEADRLAGEMVGADHKAEALVWLTVASYFLQDFWEDFHLQPELPRNIVQKQLCALKNYSIDAADDPVSVKKMLCWMSFDLNQETNNKATHPCLADRLSALSYAAPQSLTPPQKRATLFLGNRLEAYIQRLDKTREKAYQAAWYKAHKRMQLAKQRLQSLEAVRPSELTTEEKVRKVAIFHLFKENESALSQARSIVEAFPEHTVARYFLAIQILLDENVEEGLFLEAIEHLQFVIEHSPAARQAAIYQAYTATFMRGLDTSRFKRLWLEGEREWTKAQIERQKLDKTTQFMTHDIADDEIAQMRRYFSTYAEIKAAYIARKTVERFPNVPHYYVVIVYQFPRNAKELPISSSQLRQVVRDGLAFSEDYTIKIMSESTHLQRIKRVENALVYKR